MPAAHTARLFTALDKLYKEQYAQLADDGARIPAAERGTLVVIMQPPDVLFPDTHFAKRLMHKPSAVNASADLDMDADVDAEGVPSAKDDKPGSFIRVVVVTTISFTPPSPFPPAQACHPSRRRHTRRNCPAP